MNVLPIITEHPVMPLRDAVAQLFVDGYRLLIRAQALAPPHSMVNKQLLVAYLTIFIQGTAELYKGHNQIISSIITMDAKVQLGATDLTVKEIAFSLGFSNLSFFNKYFKQHNRDDSSGIQVGKNGFARISPCSRDRESFMFKRNKKR